MLMCDCLGLPGLLWDNTSANRHAEGATKNDCSAVSDGRRHGLGLCAHVWQCVQVQRAGITHLQGFLTHFLYVWIFSFGRL